MDNLVEHYKPEQDMHLLRILLAGDGSGNSDDGGDEFTIIIFRFGGDSEIMTGGIERFVENVVAAMAKPPLATSSSLILFFSQIGGRTLNRTTRSSQR